MRKGAGEKKKFAIKILKKDPSAANDNEFLFKYVLFSVLAAVRLWTDITALPRRNEVAVMSRLQHPNIVEYVEYVDSTVCACVCSEVMAQLLAYELLQL